METQVVADLVLYSSVLSSLAGPLSSLWQWLLKTWSFTHNSIRREILSIIYINQILKQPTTNMNNKKKKINRIEMIKEFPFMRDGIYNKGVKHHQILIEDPVPLEIATDVFTRLPADSVIKCKLVCKSWQTLIDDLIDNDPAFVELHTRRRNSNSVSAPTFLFLLDSYNEIRFQLGEYNDKVLRSRFKVSKLGNPQISLSKVLSNNHYRSKWEIIGPCNGLICISSTYNNSIYICNPFSRENVNLPKLKHNEVEGFDYAYISNGFGYHRFTKEYKVVRIYFNKYAPKSGQLHVYTLGSRKWRSKGEISNRFGSSYWGCGEFVNGALHWFNDRREIVSLDLVDDEFRIVPLPPPLLRHDDDRGCMRLGELRGCLCVFEGSSKCESLIIWMMKKNENTWFKKFIQYTRVCVLQYSRLALLKGNEILLEDRLTETIQSFDVRTDKLTLLEHISDLGSFHMTIPYVKSFVSLKALGEEDARIRHCSSSRAESKIKKK